MKRNRRGGTYSKKRPSGDVRASVIENRASVILNRRRRVGIIGGKGSRDRAHANLWRTPSEMGSSAPTVTGRRKIIIESIARSKTRLNMGRVPSEMGQPSGVIGGKPPAIKDTEGGISAIVNSIMRMIFGK